MEVSSCFRPYRIPPAIKRGLAAAALFVWYLLGRAVSGKWSGMSDPLFAAWAGPDPGPFVKVFEPWDAPARTAPPVPVKFSRVPLTIDPADLALLRSCGDLVGECRREWQRCCEARLRAALVAVGAIPAGATDAEVIVLLDASRGKLFSVAQPDGSLECFWGSAYLCSLPPDPLAGWRASVDARLRDGLF